MGYYTLGDTLVKEHGHIEELTNFNSSWMLHKGRIIGDEFPKDAVFQFHGSGGNQLTDFVNNIQCAVIVSERFKEILDSFDISEEYLEYLPFTLADKNGKHFEGTYYIVNPLDMVECLDIERVNQAAKSDHYWKDNPKIFRYGGIQFSSDTREKIIGLNYVVVDENKIPEDKVIFRIKEFPEQIIFRNDLLQKILDSGLTGMPIKTASTLDFKNYQL